MPATRLPSFQFYPGDWLKDPKLRSVSIAARGLWMDLICLMSESDPRGYLQDATGRALSEKQIARMTGCAQQTVKKLLQELEVSGVFSRTETEGIIYSRRIVRDEEIRMKNRENGCKGGNPQLMKPVNPSVNRDANRNLTPSSSSSSSSSSSKNKEENPKKDSCSEVPKTEPSEPTILKFPVRNSTKPWNLSESKLNEYAEAYPRLDVLAECRRALQWAVDNPAKRKTAVGMPRFLNGWLSGAENDRVTNRKRGSAASQNNALFDGLERFLERESGA